MTCSDWTWPIGELIVSALSQGIGEVDLRVLTVGHDSQPSTPLPRLRDPKDETEAVVQQVRWEVRFLATPKDTDALRQSGMDGGGPKKRGWKQIARIVHCETDFVRAKIEEIAANPSENSGGTVSAGLDPNRLLVSETDGMRANATPFDLGCDVTEWWRKRLPVAECGSEEPVGQSWFFFKLAQADVSPITLDALGRGEGYGINTCLPAWKINVRCRLLRVTHRSGSTIRKVVLETNDVAFKKSEYR